MRLRMTLFCTKGGISGKGRDRLKYRGLGPFFVLVWAVFPYVRTYGAGAFFLLVRALI